MAQNLIIANASYSDVPAITVPLQGGGSASFVDTTDADATAEDLMQGKTAYVDGVKITGTGSGGGGSKYGITLDAWLGELNSSGQLQLPTGGNVDLVVSDIKSLVSNAFYYKFSRCNSLQSVTFADLEQCGTTSCLDRGFYACTNLKTASFPKLTSANGGSAFSYTFNGCTKLVSAEFPLLDIMTGTGTFQYAFGGCTVLESVSFPSLRVIGNANAGTGTTNRQFYYAFQNCNKLTEIRFPALEEIYCNGTGSTYGTFYYNAKLKKIYFPKLHTITKTANYTNTGACNNIFNNCTALTEVHFAEENQSAIQSSTGFSTKWGAPSSCTIYFDL